MILHGTEKAVAKPGKQQWQIKSWDMELYILRVTPTVLPLWHTHTRSNTHAHARAYTPTHTENWRSIVSWEGGQKETDQGWQEHKADESDEISFWNVSARWTTTVIYSYISNDDKYACLSKPFKHLCVWIAGGHPSVGEKLVPQRKRSRWLS